MTIQQATTLSHQILLKLGFRDEEASLITKNLIAAELVERKSHGLVRLPAIARNVRVGNIKVTDEDIEIISEHSASLHFNAKYKPGFYAIYKSLEHSLEKVKKSGIVAVGIKDMAYASGYIGDYARIATEHDLIYIGFHNSPAKGLIPYGSIKSIWGTDPVTIGIPTHEIPVILDMASSQCTFGELMVAKSEGRSIKKDIALDKDGNMTIDPAQAMEGGILPIAGHKGSGLACIVELLGGALSNSRVGGAVDGGWGSFYILIDPNIFRNLTEFKDDVQKAIQELKSAPKAQNVKEIFFPGEQSFFKRKRNLKLDEIVIGENLNIELNKLK